MIDIRALWLSLPVIVLTMTSVHAQGGNLDQAWAALQRGDAETAVHLVSTAIKEGGLSIDDVGAAYNMRGMAFMKMEDFTNAEADLNVAISLVPRFAAALANRGLVRAKLERYTAAIADFDQALALVPGAPEVLFMRGNARFDTNDFAHAIDDYSQALKAAPEHWMALMNRCDALGKLGRMDEAKADCARAKSLAPDAELVARVEQALGPCDCKPAARSDP